jgi:hypothetical protein
MKKQTKKETSKNVACHFTVLLLKYVNTSAKAQTNTHITHIII